MFPGPNNNIGQPGLLKQINRALILEMFQHARCIARPQLVEKLGLSRPTIDTLVKEMVNIGVIRETGAGDSKGGRRPLMLEFNPNAAYAIGALLDKQEWFLVATDLDAQIIHRTSIKFKSNTPEDTIAALVEGNRAIRAQLEGETILQEIGLAMPVSFDQRTGMVSSGDFDLGWKNVPWIKIAEDALQQPVNLIRRSQAGALAEYWRGSKQYVSDLVYIGVNESGVSAGILHQGKLFLGSDSSAGNIGSMTLLPAGPFCPVCGGRGCLDQLASGRAVVELARGYFCSDRQSLITALAENHPEKITPAVILQAAQEGDRLANELLMDAATYLGIAVANTIFLFSPEMVIIGGTFTSSLPVYIDSLNNELQRRMYKSPLANVKIEFSQFSLPDNAVGAAALVLEKTSKLLFSD